MILDDYKSGIFGDQSTFDPKYNIRLPEWVNSYDEWLKSIEVHKEAHPESYEQMKREMVSQLVKLNPTAGFASPDGLNFTFSGQGGSGQPTSQYIYDQAYKDAGSGQMELDNLNKQYGTLADDLKAYYGDAAKRAGTYSGTGEFDAGLKYQTAQGYSGAEYALRNRMNALNRALGKEEIGQSTYDPKTGLINKLPFQASNPASTIDNPTNAVGIGTAPPPTNDVGGNAEQPSTGTFGSAGISTTPTSTTQDSPTNAITSALSPQQQTSTTSPLSKFRRNSTLSRYLEGK